MILPEYTAQCIRILEEAGYEAYAVGGCVRDSLLGIEPHDFDLCTNALPETIRDLFAEYRLVLAGMKHGTVTVITSGGNVEITTYRTEGDYTDNRHPEWVKFVPDIKEDLARRDFTVNAMAWSPTRGLVDPFGGQQDLKEHVLRAVGNPAERFREDSLRILRGVRFAVRFHMDIAPETEEAMIAQAPLMDNLSRERVFDEMSKLLPLVTAVDLIRFAPILTQVIPELAPMVDFDQCSRHHAYDLYTHTASVTQFVPGDLTLRWAALLHDIGKVPTFTLDAKGHGHFYGHAQKGAEMADAVLRRLRAPNALREEAVLLIDMHMTRLIPDKKLLRRCISRYGEETVRRLIWMQDADMHSKGTHDDDDNDLFVRLRKAMAELDSDECVVNLRDLAVGGRDMIKLNLEGKAIGDMLNYLLELVMDEVVPNEKLALMAAAKEKLAQNS